MENYYTIEISKALLILWIVLGILLSFATAFLILIVPLCYYFILKNCKYNYNDEKLIVEKGVFNKYQQVVPLYRIINITADENIFNYGTIYIKDKEQLIRLKYTHNPKKEMLKLSISF